MSTIISVKEQKEPKLTFGVNTPSLVLFDLRRLKNYLISKYEIVDIDIEYIIEEMETIFIDNSLKNYSIGIKIEETPKTFFITAIPIKDQYKEYVICDTSNSVYVGDSSIMCIMQIDDYTELFGHNFAQHLVINASNKLFTVLSKDSFSINKFILEPVIEKSSLDDSIYVDAGCYINDKDRIYAPIANLDSIETGFDDEYYESENYYSDEDLNLIEEDF